MVHKTADETRPEPRRASERRGREGPPREAQHAHNASKIGPTQDTSTNRARPRGARSMDAPLAGLSPYCRCATRRRAFEPGPRPDRHAAAWHGPLLFPQASCPRLSAVKAVLLLGVLARRTTRLAPSRARFRAELQCLGQSHLTVGRRRCCGGSDSCQMAARGLWAARTTPARPYRSFLGPTHRRVARLES